jgi:GNAT superfamily N-acetyltransferase
VDIRPARTSEGELLAQIVQRAYAMYIPRIGRRPAPMDDEYGPRIEAGQVFVAQDAGAAVGLIVLLRKPEHLLIENVAVDPPRQRSGVGRALFAHAERYASEHGLSELRLYTNAAMVENLRLYPRLGYVEYDRRLDAGFQRVFFAKSIRAGPPAAGLGAG